MSKYGAKNVSEEDRKIRFGAAGALAVVAMVVKKKSVKSLLYGVSAILGTTGAMRSCPIYSFLGVNTNA